MNPSNSGVAQSASGLQNFKADVKIIVVGMANTGKTSFVQKWTKGTFSDQYKATIVSEFGFKIYQHKGTLYRIQVWDIAGQDQNINLTKIFTKGSLGFIVCSDATVKSTLDDALKWKKTINDSARFPDGKELNCMLIENKSDLLSEEDLKNDAALKDFGNKNGFNQTFRVSAKTGSNIDESMESFIQQLLNRMEEYHSQGNEIFKAERNIVELDKSKYKNVQDPKTKGDTCC